jgi:hypothetical protein
MNKLELLNRWASRLSVEEIKNLPEDEVLRMAMERPGHPGQYGFMFPGSRFVSDTNLILISFELMKRLGEVENLKEKMLVLNRKIDQVPF